MKQSLFFGYHLIPLEHIPGAGNPRQVRVAVREKAVLDYLYLNARINNAAAMHELRLDSDLLLSDFDWPLFNVYLRRFKSRALERRSAVFKELYHG